MMYKVGSNNSTRKRSADTCDEGSFKRAKILSENFNSNTSLGAQEKLEGISLTYKIAKSLKQPFHGIIFQWKLLMLFIHRALRRKYNFLCATEMHAAESFDDIVFQYKEEIGGENTYRFVQAKHKKCPAKTQIGVPDLRKESHAKNTDFSLQKYFESFCKIKKNELFGGQFKDFIICTNTGFRNDVQSGEWKNYMENDILYLENMKAKIYQINEESSLIETLFKSYDEKLVEEFIKKFYIILYYPNEEELEKILINEIGKIWQMFDAELITYSFQREIITFLKDFNNGHAKYYSNAVGEEFFINLIGKMSWARISTLTEVYCEKLEKYDLNFNENYNLKEYFKGNTILHVATQNTLLNSIKVLNTLKNLQSLDCYFPAKNFFFFSLSDLCNATILQLVLNAMQPEKTPYILAIECSSNYENLDLSSFFKELSVILCRDNNKKMIIIAPDCHAVTKIIKDVHKEQDHICFKHLDDESQEKILLKELSFQGKSIPFKKLLDNNFAKELIDETILSRLLSENIKIGEDKNLSFVCNYYIERFFCKQLINPNVLKDSGDIFFITGINEKRLERLGIDSSQFSLWQENASSKVDKNIIIPPSSERGKLEKLFQNICIIFEVKTVHWLQYAKYCLDDRKEVGTFIWIKTRGDWLVLNNYIHEDASSYVNISNYDSFMSDILFHEKYFSRSKALEEKVIIIANNAGFGKSTVLTNIAANLKKTFTNYWVIRINLNEYAFDKYDLPNYGMRRLRNSLMDINFNEADLNEAIDFILGMIWTEENDDPLKKLQCNLFKKSLLGYNTYKKPQIVILFDGFDEISPTYKEKTHILLKSLQKTNLRQMWITTRDHEKYDLERKLETTAYFLKPLMEIEELTFLKKFWYDSLKNFEELSEESVQEMQDNLSIYQMAPIKPWGNLDEFGVFFNFDQYAKELLNKFHKSLGYLNKEFTSNPQNLKMLAEIVYRKGFQSIETLSLSDLYNTFIKMKLTVFREEKTAGTGNEVVNYSVKKFLQNSRGDFRQVALRQIFFEEYKSGKYPGLVKYDNIQEKSEAQGELVRIGLVSYNGDDLQFNHRSYAEFFLSEYLIYYLEDKYVQELFVEKVLCKPDYALIRIFINDQIKTKFNTKMILTKNLKNINFENNINEGNFFIFQFLLNKLKIDMEVENLFASATSDEKYPVMYSMIKKCSNKDFQYFFNFILENFNIKILRALILSDKNENNILHIILSKNETLTELLKYIGDYLDKDDIKKLMLKPNKNRETVVGTAFKDTNLEKIDILLKFLKNHIQQDFVKCRKLILKANINKETIIHLAIKSGNIEAIKKSVYLFNFGEDIQKILTEILICKSMQAENTSTQDFLLDYFMEQLEKVNFKKMSKNIKMINLILRRMILQDTTKMLKGFSYITTHCGDDILKKVILRADGNKNTILHFALRQNNIEISRNFIKCLMDVVGKNIFSKLALKVNDEKHSIIHISLLQSKENLKIVLELLKVHLTNDVMENLFLIPNISGYIPLTMAVFDTNPEKFQVLLDFVKYLGDDFQKCMITKSIKKNILKLIIQQNIGVLETFLTYMKTKFEKKILRDLVLKLDEDGKTALSFAVESGRTETVNILLEYVKTNISEEILKKLVEKSDKFGDNVFKHGIQKSQIDGFYILCNFVQNYLGKEILKNLITQTNNNGDTILIVAATICNATSIRYLLNYIKNNFGQKVFTNLVLRTNIVGDTVLCIAERSTNPDIFQAFLRVKKELYQTEIKTSG